MKITVLPKGRDLSVDIFRGLAVVMVVLGHANRGAIERGSAAGEALRLLDWVLYAVHMPAFFYMAGYFTHRSLRHARRSAYLRSRIPNVVAPYVIWSVLFCLIGLAMGLVTRINHPIPISRLAEIAWNPIHVLWFLYVLLIMQLILAAARNHVVALLVAVLVADAAVSLSGSASQMGILGRLAIHSPFFFMGALLSDRGLAPIGGIGRPGLLAAGSAALFLLGVAICRRAGVAEPVQFGTIPLTALGVFALAAAGRAVDRVLPAAGAVLARVGQASLAIYLLHIPVLAIVPRALRAVGLDDDAVRIAAGTVVGVGGSYLVFVLLTHVKLARPLGLR